MPTMTFRRMFPWLVSLWAVRNVVVTFELAGRGRLIWSAVAMLWLIAAGLLLMGRLERLASWIVVIATLPEFVASSFANREGLSMLAWLGAISALTVGLRRERLLLLKVCATVVYSFAVLSKLNPSWLAGTGVEALVVDAVRLAWLEPFFEIPMVPVLCAVAVLCVEGFLAIGLWFSRTRKWATILGVVVHLAFVAALFRSFFSFAHLTMLNGGLLACYPAFWGRVESRPTTGFHRRGPPQRSERMELNS